MICLTNLYFESQIPPGKGVNRREATHFFSFEPCTTKFAHKGYWDTMSSTEPGEHMVTNQEIIWEWAQSLLHHFSDISIQGVSLTNDCDVAPAAKSFASGACSNLEVNHGESWGKWVMLYLSVSFHLRNFHEYHEIMNEFHLQNHCYRIQWQFWSGTGRPCMEAAMVLLAREKLWWLPGAYRFFAETAARWCPRYVCLSLVYNPQEHPWTIDYRYVMIYSDMML